MSNRIFAVIYRKQSAFEMLFHYIGNTLNLGKYCPWKTLYRATFINRKNLKGGCRQRGKLLPIHSRKWNQNDVLTTYKAIIKGLPAGLFTDHANYHHIPKIDGFFFFFWEGTKSYMAAEGGIVSHYYILVISKSINFMSLFRHQQFFSAESGIRNI